MSITVDLGSRIVNSLPIRGGEKVVVKLRTAHLVILIEMEIKFLYVKKVSELCF